MDIQGNSKDIEIISIKNDINKNKKQIDIISQEWNTKVNIETNNYLLIKIPHKNFEIEIIGSVLNDESNLLYIKDKINSFSFHNDSDIEFKYNYLFECNKSEEYVIKINAKKEVKTLNFSSGSVGHISKIHNIHYILKYKYNESDNTIQDLKTDISCNKTSKSNSNIKMNNTDNENDSDNDSDNDSNNDSNNDSDND
jgi:hypothetical protein